MEEKSKEDLIAERAEKARKQQKREGQINYYGPISSASVHGTSVSYGDFIVNVNGEKVDAEFMEQLSKWMKDNRKKKKMTQKNLAEKTNIDLKYLQKIGGEAPAGYKKFLKDLSLFRSPTL